MINKIIRTVEECKKLECSKTMMGTGWVGGANGG